jgi:hypothetical protein
MSVPEGVGRSGDAIEVNSGKPQGQMVRISPALAQTALAQGSST